MNEIDTKTDAKSETVPSPVLLEPTRTTQPAKQKLKLSLSLDLRLIIGVLVIVIIVMLALWRPWTSQPNDSSRTISVTGEATISAAPDKFVFSPSYDFQDANKSTALTALTTKQTAVVAGLKKLGVTDSQINADSSGYNDNYTFDDSDNMYDYTLNMTVTLTDKTLSQKVQDYLVTTDPTGSVSPNAEFSTTKQKQLDSEGRDQAIADARSKAEQSAKNLGFKIGKVKSVDDSGSGGGTVQPFANNRISTEDVAGKASTTNSLPIESGQSDSGYSVTVVYYVR